MTVWSPGLTEYGPIRRLVVKHAGDAFVSADAIEAEWRALHFAGPPAFDAACREYDRLLDLVAGPGVELCCLPRDRTSLDSVYVRDASVVGPRGVILCRMGKAGRVGEPEAQRRAFAEWGVPIAGAIEAPGRLEGGDVVWLDDRTLVVGHGYRTNGEGIRQLGALVGEDVEVLSVPLPHWRGPNDVFHLMSMLSPVDRDLAVVYGRLLPVPFREWLLGRGIGLVDVPDEECASMGANVLAVAPRRCVMLAGNPVTRARLEAAGAQVAVYDGREISLKGGGGPTCLTRPVVRAPDSGPPLPPSPNHPSGDRQTPTPSIAR